MSNSQTETNILWTPHPGPQTEALKRIENEILYGGARGGGKTDAGINWLLYDVDNPKFRGLVIRRNATDLVDWIDRANTLYSQLGVIKAGNPPEFKFPSGAIIRTGHLGDDDAYTKYQGHEYHRMLIEELTHIPNEKSYLRLISSCRSTIPELHPQIFSTTNPGSIGHSWVKGRFIDVVVWGKPYYYKVGNLQRSRIFIHATIDDNPTLIKNDPNYIAQLEELKDKDEELYKAWRFGSWDVFAGQVFREFDRNTHVIKQIIPRRDMPHYLSFDWGYTAPFSCHASAVIPMKAEDGQVFNRVVTYQEWYGTEKTPRELATLVYNTSHAKKFEYGYCDPSMFNRQSDGSIPISEEIEHTWQDLNKRLWVTLKPGTKNRISRWATMHNWLSMAPDGLPYWLITENCINLIRTIPIMVYDEHNPEDIDSSTEDHAVDESSYFLTQVKFIGAIGGIRRGLGMRGKLIERIKRFKPMKATIITEQQTSDLLKAFENAKLQHKDWKTI